MQMTRKTNFEVEGSDERAGGFGVTAAETMASR